MANTTAVFPLVTVGLDVGDKVSVIVEVDAAGEASAPVTILTQRVALEAFFRDRPRCRVVLEVGTHSPWIERLLTPLGHEVIVANATELYRGRRRKRKNDRLDAEFLARQGRADVALLYPIRHRGAQAQTDLALLRARDQLVRTRTALVNHVRGAVKSMGGRLRSCSTPAFAAHATAQLPPELRPALGPLLTTTDALSAQIAGFDAAIRGLITRHPEAARLQQVAGVGPLTAVAVILLVEDPGRFPKIRDVGAYFGLVPRLDQSGDANPQRRISKAGDPFGRRLLVSAAQYILGPFGPACDLRRHGEAIAARGGANAKKRAVVAVARKLAVLLVRLWQTEAPYEPERHGRGCTA